MKESPSTLYNKMPKVDSPEQLDRQILQQARELAPEPTIRTPSKWAMPLLPLAATACLIGLTVAIIQPGFEHITSSFKPSPSFKTAPMATAELEFQPEAAGEQRTIIHTNSAQINVNENPLAPVEMNTKVMASAPTAIINSNEIHTESANQLFSDPNVSMTNSLAADADPSSSPLALLGDVGNDIGGNIRQPQKRASANVAKRTPETTLKQPQSTALTDTQQRLLDKIQALIEQGDMDSAIIAVEEFKEMCPQCDIPVSFNKLIGQG